MNKQVRRWLGPIVTVAALALVAYHVSRSPEWRDFDWDRLWGSFLHAKLAYLIAASAVTLITYLIRSARWRYFMDPIKRASLWVLFSGHVLGFGSIYLIGRVGELIRPAYIARMEGVPFSSMLAVLVLERIYDVFAMVFIFAVALHFTPLPLVGRHASRQLAQLHQTASYSLVVILVAIAVLVFLRLRTEWIEREAVRHFGFLPQGLKHKLRGLFDQFVEGLAVIRNWKDLGASIVSTVVLWFFNILVVWLVFRSLGGSLNLSFMSAALILFCEALGLLVQVPGVGGGFQVVVFFSLTRFFAVPKEDATSAAILLWIIILLPCMLSAIAILLYQGLSFKKLRHIAKEQQIAAEHQA